MDPESALRLHPNDRKRIIRALEVWHETGKTISRHNRETAALPERFPAVRLCLSYANREHLRRRIDLRVEEMVSAGLVEEVRRLLKRGVSPECTSMQAIGYKELIPALQGACSMEQAVEQVKLRSRQYAKRQLTWFRRDERYQWYLWGEEPDFSAALRFATEKLHEAGLG